MSRSRREMIRCSRCSAQQPFTVWESINVSVDPNLKQALVDGDLTTSRCTRCGNETHAVFDCLYHDMEKSLAIWLNEEDDQESQTAKEMFLAATQIKTSRTVRTLHELYDKIMVFEDDLDDFEMELFKLSVCIRKQIDLSLPFHYAGIECSFFGRKSLVFVVSSGDDFETIRCSIKDYTSATHALRNTVRPLLDDSAFAWAHVDRIFIVRVLEDAGLMRAIIPSTPQHNAIRVHTLGRTPKFHDPHDLDEWLFSGANTYEMETWQIGKDVAADQAAQYRDPQTGDLYVFYQIVEGQWKGRFVSRRRFEQLKGILDRGHFPVFGERTM